MNFSSGGFETPVGMTRNRYRESGYLSGLTLIFDATQGTPLTFSVRRPFDCQASPA